MTMNISSEENSSQWNFRQCLDEPVFYYLSQELSQIIHANFGLFFHTKPYCNLSKNISFIFLMEMKAKMIVKTGLKLLLNGVAKNA